MLGSNSISVKEASKRYRLSESHIRNLLSKGVITGEKFAGVWMVDPSSLEKHKLAMYKLGKKKHGVWSSDSRDSGE